MLISDWSSDVCSSDLRLPPICVQLYWRRQGRDNRQDRDPGARSSTFQRYVGCGRGYGPPSVSTSKFAPICLRGFRSEERRVGKECVSTCTSRWSAYH